MPQIKTIPEILSPIAPIAQYLSANDSAEKGLFNSADLDPALAMKIYVERRSIEWMYSRNPTDATLRGTANYLYALLGKYALLALRVLNIIEQAPPVVSGPNSLSINTGQTATFTIGVTSGLAYTIAWYRNGVLIPGAVGPTYNLPNAQIADSGAVFSAIVTNAAGSTASANATLTVTSALQGQWYYSDTDYGADIRAAVDNIPWQDGGVFNITDGDPFTIFLPEAAENNKFLYFRYPDSQDPRVSYFNTPLNQGPIPDQAFEENESFGGNRYTYTRQAVSMELSTTPIILS